PRTPTRAPRIPAGRSPAPALGGRPEAPKAPSPGGGFSTIPPAPWGRMSPYRYSTTRDLGPTHGISVGRHALRLRTSRNAPRLWGQDDEGPGAEPAEHLRSGGPPPDAAGRAPGQADQHERRLDRSEIPRPRGRPA